MLSGLWDSRSVLRVKGIPEEVTRSVEEEINIETLHRPDADGDTEQRESPDTDVADAKRDGSDKIGGDEGFQVMTRRVRITKQHFIKFGYSARCPLRIDMQAGVPKPTAHHTDECRLRIYLNR